MDSYTRKIDNTHREKNWNLANFFFLSLFRHHSYHDFVAKQKPNVLTACISALSTSLFSASSSTTVRACTCNIGM